MIGSPQTTSLVRVLAASASILAWPFSTHSVLAQGGYNLIVNVHSGRCMEVGVRKKGANVKQWSCHTAPSQVFLLASATEGSNRIMSVYSRKCIDVTGAGQYNGANLQQWDCDNGPNQKFRLERTNDGSFLIRPIHSNKCLEVAGWNRKNRGNIQQWDCHGGANQQWWLRQR